MKQAGNLKVGLFCTVVALAVAGCLPYQVKDRKNATGAVSGGSTVLGASSVAAFQATVYPLVTMHCSACHVSTNQPFFAGTNVQVDHDALTSQGKVDLNNPMNSRLVQRLSQDMHNCWGTCSQNAADMQAAIQKWADMIKSSGSTSTSTDTTINPPPPVARMNTIEMVVPATVPGPGGTTFVTMSWPLANGADTITPDITGATFSLDIQMFDGFSYLVKNLRITSPSTAVYVSDVRITVNGVIRPNDSTFSLVDTMIPMNAGGSLISPSSMVMLKDKGPGVDKLAISFVKLKVASANGCKNLAGWQTAVKPVFVATCNRCHNAGNGFDTVDGTDAQICARTLGRIDTAVPANSQLILYPLTGSGHAGGGGLINQTTANSWMNWITSER